MNTANRLLGMLALFTIEKPVWTVEEAAKEMRVSVSTAYRYFADLSKAGLLDPFMGGKYVLGPAIIEGDRKIRMTDPLIQVGRPAIQRLVTRAGSSGIAILCRVYRKCVMCVHQEPAVIPDGGLSYERGRPMPMFRGASSKIIFANLPARSVRWFFDRELAEIRAAGLGSNWESVKANLRRIRKAGTIITHGEVDNGRVGIAAPVFGPEGNVIGSVGFAIAEPDATPPYIADISSLVQAASREIEAGLGLLSPGQYAKNLNRPFSTNVGPAEISSAADSNNMAAPKRP